MTGAAEFEQTFADRVTCSVGAGIAHVRLSRPDKLNALDRAMFEGLVAAGLYLRDRTDVSAVVLAGEGRVFCAGLDVEQFDRMRDGTSDVVVLGQRLGAARALAQQAVHVWSMVPIPVIAAVHGVAFGGGLQIALGADIRIVAPDTRLAMMEIQWGLTPDMAGTQLLPDLVRRDVAKELTFTGRVVEGAEAVELGLATRLAPDPIRAATEMAREIASHSRGALMHAKHLLELAGRVPLAEGLDAEQEAVAELIGSAEQLAAIERRRG